MYIEGATNVTDILKSTIIDIGNGVECADKLSPKAIENLLVVSGLEKGSFSIFKIVYSDEDDDFYFQYPSGMYAFQALKYFDEVMKKLNTSKTTED
jgi:hypothetical protein